MNSFGAIGVFDGKRKKGEHKLKERRVVGGFGEND
jgi:hypothetical protein